MDLKTAALTLHRESRGKFAITSKVPVKDTHDLSLAYSPGVAAPCLEITDDCERVYDYTAKGNMVAVVSDGTAVLGLGDIGPLAALPVMEGKAILFKTFANIDAVPVVLATKDVEAIIETVATIAPTYGGINLEDISGPRCFAVEDGLKKRLSIPVFHDDQHGTAVVCYAGLINALKIVGKSIDNIRIVINGAGAAGVAIAHLLRKAGCGEIRLCDTKGVIRPGRPEGMNAYKEELAELTNSQGERGDLASVLRGADVFIGLSVAGALNADMVRQMAPRPLVFALANPDPEIQPQAALAAGAAVVATGRSDFPNQVNNVLGFPGIFRGALDARASCINEEMRLAAAGAIAGLIDDSSLRADYVIPNPFDRRVAKAVATAVAEAAVATGVADPDLSGQDLIAQVCENLGPAAD